MAEEEGGTRRLAAAGNSLTSIFPDAKSAAMAEQRYGTVSTFEDEIMRETGFEREKDAFDLRLKALTKPDEYQEEREKALNDVGDAVKTAYANTYKLYRTSGESDEKSRAAAKAAGIQAKQLQMRQFHVRFPDADVQVYKQKRVKEAGAFVR